MTPSEDDLETCARVLEFLGSHEDILESSQCRKVRTSLAPLVEWFNQRMYAGRPRDEFVREKEITRANNRKFQSKRDQDRDKINKCSLRAQRLSKLQLLQEQNDMMVVPLIPDGAVQSLDSEEKNVQYLEFARSCYVCKNRFNDLHFFYDQLCPSCADFNYFKRTQTRDLSGRFALVTGGRVKIGFQVAVKLLRAGANVIVTSRFPMDTVRRYESLEDSSQWISRLQVVGLDFRDIRRLEEFSQELCHSLPQLDILINNACQTIRRPAGYYRELVEYERLASASSGIVIAKSSDPSTQWSGLSSAESSQLVILPEDSDTSLFAEGLKDVNLQPVDLRDHNSWLLKLEEVSTAELAEVLAINAIAPFVLDARLKPLMTRNNGSRVPRYIVNVSAMEGKFYRFKGPEHPHTNMAKAALNMLTRTSALEYAKHSIFMYAIDTGWINDENPLVKADRIAKRHNFQTPIDEVDAAARVLDPIFSDFGQLPDSLCGTFLKNYKVTEW